MKRGLLLLVPMALGAIVFAQETEDAAALVKQLGSEDYAVREAAQKKLVEMGETAVPALEEALKSEDLEVRLRAGRALRAIGSAGKKADDAEAPEAPEAPAPRGQFQGMSMSMGPGKVTVTVTEMVDGKPETKTYEGATVEELKEKYPELRKHLDGFRFRFGNRDDLDMDMDKFWNDWKESNTGLDEDIRKWQEESRRQMEAMRRWMEQYRPQQRRGRPEAGLALPGPMLGVRAYAPPEALDAQLDLRGVGLVIEAVEKDSLADRLGLQRYDVLLELNGKEIRGVEDVAGALRGRGDAKATAKVVRKTLPLMLDEASAGAPK